MRILRLIENMTLGRNAVGYLTESMHGAGSPQAYSETSNFSGPDSSPHVTTPPSEQPGQFAAFTSRPFRVPRPRCERGKRR